ncbi:hypothetical protein MRB53_035999 [Persea americana]|uniref:Uncharacterized protein n=1 Tax=Persea americana TaxID=3435 RepID=A0ACC2K6J5_PERAE|nr:hypothetical protein MRB53_035999 [Persea americana]
MHSWYTISQLDQDDENVTRSIGLRKRPLMNEVNINLSRVLEDEQDDEKRSPKPRRDFFSKAFYLEILLELSYQWKRQNMRMNAFEVAVTLIEVQLSFHDFGAVKLSYEFAPHYPCPSPGTHTNYERTSTITTGTNTSAAKISNSHTSHGQGSCTCVRSNSLDSTITAPLKPHTGGDVRWDAIQLAQSRDSPLGISNFRLLECLGYGDIGSVYLLELKGTSAFFVMKVMDKASLASRNKLLRAQTERQILGLLDHPFLPTQYSYFETDKFYCLVMEFCSGGNLDSLWQKQPHKFYASEVLLALGYLHMLGIVYRDLKPENVLVRDEGHRMLSDFDLSLQCSVNPTLVKSSSGYADNGGILDSDDFTACIQPSFFPLAFYQRRIARLNQILGSSPMGLFQS